MIIGKNLIGWKVGEKKRGWCYMANIFGTFFLCDAQGSRKCYKGIIKPTTHILKVRLTTKLKVNRKIKLLRLLIANL